MKLDFDICKGGRVHNKKIIGMRYNYKDIYSLIGNYNAYTVEITESGYKTVNFDISDEYYYSAIDPYFDMGNGTKVYENILSYTYTTPGTYQIITSARIDRTVGNSPEVLSIDGIRRDTISLENAFEKYGHVREFNPQNLKTTRVTTMKNMFYNCWYNPNRNYELELTTDGTIIIDFSDWDTSNVTDMSGMFASPQLPSSYRCTFAPSNLNTSNVTNMSGMFESYDCNYNIDFSLWDTSKVTDMSRMFYKHGTGVLNIDNFNTGNVITFKNMFYDSPLRGKEMYFDENNKVHYIPLDLSNWDTSNAIDMSGMFYGCENLESIEGLNSWQTNNVTDISYMFYDCYKLTSLRLNNWQTNNVINMSYMFYNCTSLAELDLSGFNTSSVTDMSYMLFGCTSLIELDLSNFDISEATNVDYILWNCHDLYSLKLNNCSKSTISAIINSAKFPTGSSTASSERVIYVDSNVIGDLEPPDGWRFESIEQQ